MSLHSFDPDVAQKVGINAAVIYQNLIFWTRKNIANGKNVHDDCVWTYNSVRAWSDLFPYLSHAQTRRALEKLVECGMVQEGNFNKSAYDRTKWYGVSTQIHLSKLANGFAGNDEPIPDSKPDTKPFTSLEVEIYDQYLKAHPNPVESDDGHEAFAALVDDGVDPNQIIAAAKAYADATKGWSSEGKVQQSDNFLCAERGKWKAYIPKQEAPRATESEQIEFWSAKINGDGFVSASSIKAGLARAIIASGKVTPEKMRERGISA